MSQKILFTLLAVVVLVTAAFAAVPILAGQEATSPQAGEVLKFDMAEDFTKFVFDPDIVRDDGFPAHGSPFITQGYLYPAGTLDETDGINSDGTPEFPDKVIGIWICRGWIYGDIENSEGLPTAVTTQVFQLGEEYSHQTIISDGFEFMEPGSIFSRAITGGTGDYRGVQGEQTQEILGINEFMGMAMRFELQLEQ